MDSRIRGLLLGLAVLVVVAVALSDLMGGVMGPEFASPGPGSQGTMHGQWWRWGLAVFTVGGVLLISLALTFRAVGRGRGRLRSPGNELRRR